MTLSLSVALTLVFALVQVAGRRGQRLSVTSEDGKEISLLQVIPGIEFWLFPSCELIDSRISIACRAGPELRLQLRLWSHTSRRQALNALYLKGSCRENDPCRVLPFQAHRLVVRDKRGQWEMIGPRGVLNASLPAQLHARLRRSNVTANCVDGLSRPLTRRELADLSGLVVEIVPRAQPLLFPFSEIVKVASDQEMALRPGRLNIVDGEAVRRLAAALLRARMRTASVKMPQLERKVEAGLKTQRTTYQRFLKQFLAQRRVPATGEAVFVLQNASVVVRMEGTEMAPGANLQLPIRAPPAEDLRDRIDSLEKALVAAIENNARLSADVKALRRIVSRRLDVTADQARFPDLLPVADCADVGARGLPAGAYLLKAAARPVLCTANGGLVALRWAAGGASLNRSLREYEEGFGDATAGDYWVGLRFLAAHTRAGDRCMALTLRPAAPAPGPLVARYCSFRVSDHADDYRLRYRSFAGNASDGLLTARGQPFSARSLFGLPSGNASAPICWRARPGVCAPLSAVEMTVSGMGERRQVVLSLVKPCRQLPGCQSQMRVATITETALYSLTAAGSGGGRGYNGGKTNPPGGRGALVRVSLVLEKGTRLAIVAGCGARLGGGGAGEGGNATIIADRERGLLAMAGGGGGAAFWVGGLHGQASEAAGDAWFPECCYVPPAERLRQIHYPGKHSGLGWADVRETVMTGPANTVVGTGGRNYLKSGGGGGGYNGGGAWTKAWVPGGGGGSFCNRSLVRTCMKTEGGNHYDASFVLIERHTCF